MRFYFLILVFLNTLNADIATNIVDKSNEFYSKVKDKTIQWVTPTKLSLEEKKQQHQNAIWEKVFDDLGEGVESLNALENAPQKSWIGSDKESIQRDIDTILETLIESLTDDELFAYREKITTLKKKVQNNKEDMLLYREKKIGAPVSSLIYTTKSGFDSKIEDMYLENTVYENDIRIVKDELRNNFNKIGIVLSKEQIDVLLSRIDGEDIIQISLVMDILKEITTQIIALMQQSNEEIFYAKKYYGMHLITLKLVVYIQQKYIDKVSNEYLPKIEVLITTAQNMILQTKHLKHKEENSQRRAIYSKNLEAQHLAYKASKRYKKDLILSKNSMLQAQKRANADLRLSKNTYKTVTLSSELYHLIVESQQNLTQVSKIQMPFIVPFENKKMQAKYKELTSLMQDK